MAKTDLEIFIEQEAQKSRNTGVPVKASFIERLFVRKKSIKKLHPNPEDEFCFPDIGPNMQIISSYVAQYKTNIDRGERLMDEPLYVQKIRPSGYMILNGHHRWAAAIRLGIRSVPISIVNGVFEADIKMILEASKHEKRATLDLDEVVFAQKDDVYVEKRRGIPVYGLQKKRLRQGIPAVIKNLKVRGFDVWVYSAGYYSIDDIKRFFKHYGVIVDGIITGMKKKSAKAAASGNRITDLLANRYKTTLHFDRDLLIMTGGSRGDFVEEELDCSPDTWSGAVMDAVDRMDRDEKE